MRLLKALTAAVALLGLGVAQAEEIETREHRSAMGTVAADTLLGGVAGGAVSGGIIGYRMGIQNEKDYGWGPVLATGVGIGLVAGLVWGVVDVSTHSYGMTNGPVSDGMSLREQRPADLSGTVTAPIALGRW